MVVISYAYSLHLCTLNHTLLLLAQVTNYLMKRLGWKKFKAHYIQKVNSQRTYVELVAQKHSR